MTSRTTSLRVPEGTKTVGTARVREDKTVGRSYAERELMRRTGGMPNSTFDDVADAGASAISRSVAGSAAVAGAIGESEPLGKALTSLAGVAGRKKSKYGNRKCESDGIKFDSRREMARWHTLIQMQVRQEIFDLRRQVPFTLAGPVVIGGKKKRARTYVADFVYETAAGDMVVEDVKGMLTPMYEFKRHLMKERLGIDIVEIK